MQFLRILCSVPSSFQGEYQGEAEADTRRKWTDNFQGWTNLNFNDSQKAVPNRDT